MQSNRAEVRILDSKTLSDDWYTLKKYTFDVRRRNGSGNARTAKPMTGAMAQPSCSITAKNGR